MPAAAQPNGCAAAEPERISVRIMNREFAFDADGTVIEYGDFRWH
jgi:hypothetical protein